MSTEWDRLAGRVVKAVEGERPVTPELRAEILRRDGWRCCACGATDALQIDHVWPRARGGVTVPRNLVTLCGPCNRSKSDLQPWEWTGRPGAHHRRIRWAARSVLRVVGLR